MNMEPNEYNIAKVIALKIINNEILDGIDLQFYNQWKELINLIIENENNRKTSNK